MFNEIKTQRLRIRLFKKADLMSFYQYRQDEEVARYQSWQSNTFIEALKAFKLILQSDFNNSIGTIQLAIEIKNTKTHIGDLYLSIDENHHSFIGYTLSKDFWGYGYALEAVEALINRLFNFYQVKDIRAYILPRNIKSLNLIKKLGFQYIGGIEYCLYKPLPYTNLKIIKELYP
jgi:Acetyltransferases, including N-acetylases of ribosomal proteins